MATDNSGRVFWVDYAKGIGISLVVIGHTLRGLHSSQIIAEASIFQRVDSWIYSFHMPLFFLLSGLFAERQNKRKPSLFLRDKFSTVAYPYLIWSTLQTLIQFSVNRYTNHQTQLDELTGILIHPILQFWFLYALFLIGLTDYLLRKCGLGPIGILLAFAVFWSSIRWIPLFSWLPLVAARNNGIFYALGSMINHLWGIERIERISTTFLTLTMILGYGVVTGSALHPRGDLLLMDLGVAICGIAASIALAVLIRRVGVLDLVRLLGIYSLEIYVAHTMFSACLRIALQKVLNIQDLTVHVVIGTIGGMFLPMALGMLCRRHHAEFLFRLTWRSAPFLSPRREYRLRKN